jgi:CRISPR-associated endonuclease Cas2
MYDITHDRTLQKVAKLLEKHGYERINYSVWLGWKSPEKNPILRDAVKKLLVNEAAKGSRLYVLPIKAHTLKQIRSITGHKPAELDYWTGDQKILFV